MCLVTTSIPKLDNSCIVCLLVGFITSATATTPISCLPLAKNNGVFPSTTIAFPSWSNAPPSMPVCRHQTAVSGKTGNILYFSHNPLPRNLLKVIYRQKNLLTKVKYFSAGFLNYFVKLFLRTPRRPVFTPAYTNS